MSEKEVQESQKTVVAFVAGLLVGGLLVWVFATDTVKVDAPSNDAEEVEEVSQTPVASEEDEVAEVVPQLPVGEGQVAVSDQPAGSMVKIDSATFPTEEGWIGVRSYQNETIGSILGAIAYSKSAGRVPTQIPLLAPTTAGREYAIVFFSQDSNRAFNPGGDVQLETPLTTFTAQ